MNIMLEIRPQLITIQFQMLGEKLKKGLRMTGEYIGDDDSGLEVDTEALEMEGPIDPEEISINLKVNITISFNCIFSPRSNNVLPTHSNDPHL